MIKILDRIDITFLKVSFLPGFPGHFWTYFTIEKSYSKNVLSNMNLVNQQVYRVEKVGIFMHLYGKNRFLSFLSVISMYHTQTLSVPWLFARSRSIIFTYFP
jgi:hypothetical protein